VSGDSTSNPLLLERISSPVKPPTTFCHFAVTLLSKHSVTVTGEDGVLTCQTVDSVAKWLEVVLFT
jgi:hypothetical protein